MAKKSANKSPSSTPIGFESDLWAAADALRNNMDAAEYKHVVLGLIFLKYVSYAFEAKHAALETDRAQDTLGRVYEYFLAQFASAEGKSGGQFYTPSHSFNYTIWRLAKMNLAIRGIDAQIAHGTS